MFAERHFCLPKFLGIVGDMEKDRDWHRLARFARAARGSRSQKSVDALGGPSHTTLGKIERAEWRPTRAVDDTVEKLERAYQWQPGSVDAILAGGDPTPLDTPVDTTSLPERGVEEMEKMWSAPDQVELDRVQHIIDHTWGVAERLTDAVLAHNPDKVLLSVTTEAVGLIFLLVQEVVLDSSLDSRAKGELLDRLYESRFALRKRLAEERAADVMETAPQSDAPGEAGQDEKTPSPHEAKPRPDALTQWGRGGQVEDGNESA